MFFRRDYFVDLVLRLVYSDDESTEDLANKQIVQAFRDLHKIVVE